MHLGRLTCKAFIWTFSSLCILSLYGYFTLPAKMEKAIKLMSGLSKGSITADIISNIPFEVHQKVYVFNITNKDDFFRGSKPHLEQLGPYVFTLSLHKQMSWSDGDLLTYRENRRFWFDAELSNGSLSDAVYTVDPVYAAAQEIIDKLPPVEKDLVIPLLNSRKVLFERKVGELLYEGYKDELAILAHLIKPSIPVIDGKIGYLRSQNDTDDGDITVYAGTQPSTQDKRNIVIRWRNKTSIPFFSGECARLWGSNGQLYPPFDDGSAPAEIGYFLPLLCRPWPLHFNETRYENGIYLSIYNTRNDFFSPTNGSNVTTCAQPGVWPQGVFDTEACQNSFPALISLPHFLHADKALLDDVEGLQPDVTKHDLHIDIFPMLGFPVRAATRVQVNVRIHRRFKSGQSSNPPIVYPVLWQDIVISEASVSSLLSIIWYATQLPCLLIRIGIGVCAALSILLVAIGTHFLSCQGEDDDEDRESLVDSEEPA